MPSNPETTCTCPHCGLKNRSDGEPQCNCAELELEQAQQEWEMELDKEYGNEC